MAKELPYFKFEPAEYLTKDVSFCSLSAQGLFINLCAYYWQRECNLTKTQFLRRLNNPNELNELIEEGVIDLDNNIIIIKFLDAQHEIATKSSKTNSINGSKGGRPRKINPIKTENKPNALIPLSQTKGIREDKIKEDKITSTYEKFVADIKKGGFQTRIESLYMRLRLKKGSLTPLLEEFRLHILEENRTHKDTNEFFKNFKNWLNTKDSKRLLDKYRK